jgi:hypothetical protein
MKDKYTTVITGFKKFRKIKIFKIKSINCFERSYKENE